MPGTCNYKPMCAQQYDFKIYKPQLIEKKTQNYKRSQRLRN